MFGSTANRLALRNSDIDVLVFAPNQKLDTLFEQTFLALLESGIFEYVCPIAHAKVPIIKVLH